jgi:virginiamycin B lyase
MKRNGLGFWVPLLVVVCFGSLVLLLNRAAAAGSDASIGGIVTDDAGKPLRGAPITAKMGPMSVSRYTDANGKYEITGLKPGTYRVTATAWGYSTKIVDKELSGTADLGFALKANWNPAQISTAEYVSAFGGDKDMRKLEGTCTNCHNFSWIMRRKGMTADEWNSFIPRMGDKFVTPNLSTAQLNEITPVLEKYFGPDSPVPTRDQVRHVDVSDEALHATFRMYTPPTTNIAHSLYVAPNGLVWFTEHDNYANKIASFDYATEKFQEYEMPTPRSGPHNPWVARDGMVWVTEAAAHKLAALDPETGKITEYTPPAGAGTHTLREDSQGNIWTSGKVTKFDPKTQKFTVYESPYTYDVAVDAHDNAWGGGGMGANPGLFRIDGKTGEIKVYPVADMKFVRGIEADTHENIWFGDVTNHRLGKFDTKTEKITYYRAPTPDLGIYGLVIDKKTGFIWVADYEGSNVDRFDPATGKFVEYPFPSRTQMIRFFGEDPMGRIWFTDFTNGRIGVLETDDMKISAQR